MDFSFTEVQEDVRSLARTILTDQVTLERLKELEAGTGRLDRRLWEELAKANLLGIALPEDVGGMGCGLMELCILLEEAGRRVAPVPLLATVVTAAPAIAEFGTPEQRQALLPPVIDGTTFLSTALQEAGGADPLRPGTRARPSDGGWLLDGEKVAVPWGMVANRILVSASLDDGTTAVFVVDPAAADVQLERAEATHREPQGHLVLDGTVVAEADVLGGPANRAAQLPWIYERALAGICATAVGVLEEAIRITAAYLSEREQFGRPLATFQGATLRAADAYIDTEATRMATWSAIWRLAEGRPASDELAIAKFWVADAGQRVAHACQHLHGGMGVDVDYPIHRYFLWAKELELTLGGATSQLLRLGDSLAAATA